MTNEQLDLGLNASAALYALWLAQHKKQEPDWTWLEVVGGVAGVLAYAHLRTRNHGMPTWHEYERNVWLGFGLAGVPVILGEISQALIKKRLRDDWLRRQLGG